MVESSGAAALRKAGLGSIIVAVVVLFILFMMLNPNDWAQEPANRAQCTSNLSQISKACRTWADLHRHAWPDVFTEQSTHWHEVGNTRTDAWSPVRDDGDPPQAEPGDNGQPIQSNTASFWPLVAQMGLMPQHFLCPSSHGWPDAAVVEYKSVRDFRGEPFCSYSHPRPRSSRTLRPTRTMKSCPAACTA